jgi:hypothetical protein
MADSDASARAVERGSRRSPWLKNVTAIGIDAIFAISGPVIVVVRTGIGFGAGCDGADTSQWQCVVRQQSIDRDCASWHGAALGSQDSTRIGKLPMSETASRTVSSLRAVRIDVKNLCRQHAFVNQRPWRWPEEGGACAAERVES